MNFSSDPIHNIENLITRNKTKSKSLYLVLVIVLLVALALLPIIKIDISSQSRGIIRSTTDNVPISAAISGRVEWSKLKNNNLVKKGDTLLKISKENLTTQENSQNNVQQSVSTLYSDISKLTNGNTKLQTSTAQEDYANFLSKKNELQSKISVAQLTYNRNKTLYDKQIIAKAEFEKYQYELKFSQEALQSFISQQKSTWENQKRELELQLKNSNNTIAEIKIQENNYVVIAPETGFIENFNGLQQNSIVAAGQPIAIISPTDNLIIEANVSPTDIGLIRKNQQVNFQIDAFNYNQWGLLTGKVFDIDKNITLQENQAFFKVRCLVDSRKMTLKSGYSTQVSKGMTLTARFKIANRSLFDLLFDKVDDWLNPKQLEK